MTIQIVILAAGQGKRMYSNKPKVLHTLGGKPLLSHVINTAFAVSPEQQPIIVYGHHASLLQKHFSQYTLSWVLQKDQLGTGHALQQALPKLNDEQNVLILYGDVPLISAKTLNKLITSVPQNTIGMITARIPNPNGYGRIKRDAQNKIVGIVEEKDATRAELAINEINPGIYFVPAIFLKKWLPKLTNQNAQKEYYLTDLIAHAVKEKISIHSIEPEFYQEVLGINDCLQLAYLERFYQNLQAQKLMQQGVSIIDPNRLDIRGEVTIGKDVVIDVNVILEGQVMIGDDCTIGANSYLRDVTIGREVLIKANSVIEEATIADQAVIGPFARIRPGTTISSNAHIGNFVEIKNSDIGVGSKISHLSYIGDSELGKDVNIGAGTITCNFDGANKHRTIIGDDVLIGSDSQLVAPVIVGNGATIGAGSTIIKDVPPHKLTLSHSINQRTCDHWRRPMKEKEKG